MSDPTLDPTLALARAERDAYADTCEELHRTIAGLHVEIDAHVGHREAADQRVRSLDAALTHEREASKALVAQVETLRGDLQRAAERGDRLLDQCNSALSHVKQFARERDAARAELVMAHEAIGQAQSEIVRLSSSQFSDAPAWPQITEALRSATETAAARARLASMGIDADAELAAFTADHYQRRADALGLLSDADVASLREWLASWPLSAESVPTARVTLLRMIGDIEAGRRALVAFERARDAAWSELAAIRDIVAPGNPQGTVVDAVRAAMTGLHEAVGARDEAERVRDAAIARAEKAERDVAELRKGYVDVCDAIAAETSGPQHAATIARETRQDRAKLRAEAADLGAAARIANDELTKLRAELAELRARPVLTVKALDEAMAMGAGAGAHVMAKLGHVTLPSPDRAEELAATLVGTARASMTDVPIAWSCDFADGNENARRALTNVVRAALAKLSPAPVAPAVEFTAADLTDLEEVRCKAYCFKVNRSNIDDSDRAAIRAVLAAARLCAVDADRLATALAISIPPAAGQRAKTCLELATDAIAYLRATAQKGG